MGWCLHGSLLRGSDSIDESCFMHPGSALFCVQWCCQQPKESSHWAPEGILQMHPFATAAAFSWCPYSKGMLGRVCRGCINAHNSKCIRYRCIPGAQAHLCRPVLVPCSSEVHRGSTGLSLHRTAVGSLDRAGRARDPCGGGRSLRR